VEKIRVAIGAGKGGVGKTTIACGIASVLAHQGRQVLLVDLDPQSNAAWGLGADPTAPGTAELLLGQHPEPLEATHNLFVLPGGPALKGHDVVRLDPEALADAVTTFSQDVLVFDCPPGLHHLERLGLVAADSALVVLDAHPFAIQGAARVISELESRQQKQRIGANRWALIMSRVDLRRSLDRDLDAALDHEFPGITRLTVRQDIALAVATTERRPLMDSAPGCRGAEDLQGVVRWLCNGGSCKITSLTYTDHHM
jgi:chromosome partitioning protein